MTETSKRTGSCLCGSVGITANSASNTVGACHCSMCRKWDGGPSMDIDCGTDVTFSDETAITVYVSSDWAERGFCRTCGSHLFYRMRDSGQYLVPAGLFDDQEHLVFDTQVFIDNKPSFYSFANETNNMTEAEVFAMYAPSQGETS